jgi:hypothetical protein
MPTEKEGSRNDQPKDMPPEEAEYGSTVNGGPSYHQTVNRLPDDRDFFQQIGPNQQSPTHVRIPPQDITCEIEPNNQKQQS